MKLTKIAGSIIVATISLNLEASQYVEVLNKSDMSIIKASEILDSINVNTESPENLKIKHEAVKALLKNAIEDKNLQQAAWTEIKN